MKNCEIMVWCDLQMYVLGTRAGLCLFASFSQYMSSHESDEPMGDQACREE